MLFRENNRHAECAPCRDSDSYSGRFYCKDLGDFILTEKTGDLFAHIRQERSIYLLIKKTAYLKYFSGQDPAFLKYPFLQSANGNHLLRTPYYIIIITIWCQTCPKEVQKEGKAYVQGFTSILALVSEEEFSVFLGSVVVAVAASSAEEIAEDQSSEASMYFFWAAPLK